MVLAAAGPSYFIWSQDVGEEEYVMDLVLWNSDGRSRTVHTISSKPVGFHMDSRACVLLAVRDMDVERLVLVHAGKTTDKSRTLLSINSPDATDVRHRL